MLSTVSFSDVFILIINIDCFRYCRYNQDIWAEIAEMVVAINNRYKLYKLRGSVKCYSFVCWSIALYHIWGQNFKFHGTDLSFIIVALHCSCFFQVFMLLFFKKLFIHIFLKRIQVIIYLNLHFNHCLKKLWTLT